MVDENHDEIKDNVDWIDYARSELRFAVFNMSFHRRRTSLVSEMLLNEWRMNWKEAELQREKELKRKEERKQELKRLNDLKRQRRLSRRRN
jgi:hypothetical protein